MFYIDFFNTSISHLRISPRYMVDAADHSKLEASRTELHNLLSKPQLEGIPVLVLGNKKDLPGALDEKQLIEQLLVLGFLLILITYLNFRDLGSVQDREICCYSISCKDKTNIGTTFFYLLVC